MRITYINIATKKNLRNVLNVIICILLLAINYNYCQANEKFKIVSIGMSKGAIISEEQVSQLKHFSEKREKYWTPTEEDIMKAEKKSRAYLEQCCVTNKYAAMNIHKILAQWESYRRQYIGLIEKNGDKTIWINYFHTSFLETFPDWDEHLVFVIDGGNAFFNIKVNLNTGTCYDLKINDNG